MTQTRLLLFDIDGTLLSTGRAPRRAITRALREVFQIDDDLDGLSRSSFAGKTDPEIIQAILTRNNYPLEAVNSKLDLFFKTYTGALREELPGESRARLYPGVRTLLERLDSEDEAVLGVLTGNIEEGARIKLGHFDLNPFFSTGSYGSDSADRGELPAIAVKRVFEETGRTFDHRKVKIVGDTIDDLKAARRYGAISVLVATGFFPYEELAEAGPDILFKDFSNTDEVVEALLS